jgi:hypothetical protein
MIVGVWPETLSSRRAQQRALVAVGSSDGKPVSSTIRPPDARTGAYCAPV